MKTILLGGALALSLSACGDDKPKNNTTDAGHDAGQDAGQDGGSDAGNDATAPIDPVRLRIAHLGFGTGVGPVHICAYNPIAAPQFRYSLVTSDALETGDFENPTEPRAIPYATITRHFELPATVLESLAGKEIQVYREAEAGASIQTLGTTKLASCSPADDVEPLASATLGAGGLVLEPGNSYTVVISGAIGTEFTGAGACTGAGADATSGICSPVELARLVDETTFTSTTDTRVRVVLADPRFGTLPGLCQDIYANPAPAPAPILDSATGDSKGLVPFIRSATLPAYENASPVLPADLGGGNFAPRLLTLHPAGTEASPCTAASATAAGILPNQDLIDQFEQAATGGAPVATIRPTLGVGELTTLFIAPLPMKFIETDTNAAGAGQPCDPTAGSPTCLPVATCDFATEAQLCVWIPLGFPAADTAPASP